MAGSKGAHGPRRFIRHLRMKRAVGIPSSHRMWPARHRRGRDCRRGIWWDHELNRIAIEGVDFAQDTQEGGADRFEFYSDSDEEEGTKGSSLLGDDDEYVPETEPQNVVTVSRITEPCTMLHQQFELNFEMEQQKVEKERNKAQMNNVKFEKMTSEVEMESDKLYMSSKVHVDGVKVEKESGKVELGSLKVEVESDKVNMSCANKGRGRLSNMLHQWRDIVFEVEHEEISKIDMENNKLQMVNVKFEDSGKVEMDNNKLNMLSGKSSMDRFKFNKESAKLEVHSVKLEVESDKLDMSFDKVQRDTSKEEVDLKASFSDLETDDEGCWFQDGVDLRGYSQVEDDELNDQVIDMFTSFIPACEDVFKSSKG